MISLLYSYAICYAMLAHIDTEPHTHATQYPSRKYVEKQKPIKAFIDVISVYIHSNTSFSSALALCIVNGSCAAVANFIWLIKGECIQLRHIQTQQTSKVVAFKMAVNSRLQTDKRSAFECVWMALNMFVDPLWFTYACMRQCHKPDHWLSLAWFGHLFSSVSLYETRKILRLLPNWGCIIKRWNAPATNKCRKG